MQSSLEKFMGRGRRIKNGRKLGEITRGYQATPLAHAPAGGTGAAKLPLEIWPYMAINGHYCDSQAANIVECPSI